MKSTHIPKLLLAALLLFIVLPVTQSVTAQAPAAQVNAEIAVAEWSTFYYEFIAGSTLRPRASALTWASNGGGGCIYAVANASYIFNVPLELPQGSRIDYLRIYFYDTDATSDSQAWVTYYDGAGGYVDLPTSSGVPSSGNAGYGTDLSAYMGHIVDNHNNAYVLNWRPNVVGNTMMLCGLRVAYRIDATPPESSATSQSSYANTSPVAISWIAADDYPGVSSTALWVKFGSGGAWASTGLTQDGTSGTFDYTPTSGNGTYYFATVATDMAGNVEATPISSGDTWIVYDTAAPNSSASSSAYANGAIAVSWIASDATSGLATVQLWVKFGSGGTWFSTSLSQSGTSGTFDYTPASGNGTYYFATVATDHAGNVEASPTGAGDSNTVYDNTKPTSHVQVPTLWHSANVILPWIANDNLSGVSNTTLWVKLDSEDTWNATPLSQSGTSGTFLYTFTQGEGFYYFAVVSVDRAGNQSSLPLGSGDGGCEYRLFRAYLPLTLRDYLQYFEGPWEVEPNDTYLQANGPLISGRDYRGYPDDERDYFSIYLRKPGPLTIDLTDHTGQAVQLQLFYQGIDNRVAFDTVPPYTITHTGQPGWYYIYIYTGG
ncbi:MAG: hypothetical protein RBT75_04695, partial [Anaerolineae bacterium]|nr:hypothetical protein [Anaerolineae bacterium]